MQKPDDPAISYSSLLYYTITYTVGAVITHLRLLDPWGRNPYGLSQTFTMQDLDDFQDLAHLCFDR